MISKFKCIVLMSAVFFTASQQVQADAHIRSHKQVECLSVMAYHEAKGESDAGMLAVIHTTLNRVRDSRFPNSVCSVVYQPSQYSWTKQNPKIKEKKQYERAKRLAQEVIEGKHKDVSKGALYFVHIKTNRNWLKKLTYTCTIGNHKFFK